MLSFPIINKFRTLLKSIQESIFFVFEHLSNFYIANFHKNTRTTTKINVRQNNELLNSRNFPYFYFVYEKLRIYFHQVRWKHHRLLKRLCFVKQKYFVLCINFCDTKNLIFFMFIILFTIICFRIRNMNFESNCSDRKNFEAFRRVFFIL